LGGMGMWVVEMGRRADEGAEEVVGRREGRAWRTPWPRTTDG
jgi:hypothetical protein